jgi:chorismate synthase
MKSSFGKHCRVTIFGGSHEDRIGVTLEGFPKGFAPDLEKLQRFMNRRAPGNSPFSTPRKEPDLVELETSNPLTLFIRNTNIRSSDYAQLRQVPRPGHADYTAYLKYGDSVNMEGGGPFSGRMTAPLCIAGGLAMQVLAQHGIRVGAHISSIADKQDSYFDPTDIPESLLKSLAEAEFPVISNGAGEQMKRIILDAKISGDSVGGIVEACAIGVPSGLGGAMFDGVESVLSPILFGIPGSKGVEFGTGFAASMLKGSENNDPFIVENDKVRTVTNHHGGILGGITSGMPLILRVAFKPTPSIAMEQQSVNLSTLEPETLQVTGRHDPCIVLRAVPVVEAAIAIGLLDLLMERITL